MCVFLSSLGPCSGFKAKGLVAWELCLSRSMPVAFEKERQDFAATLGLDLERHQLVQASFWLEGRHLVVLVGMPCLPGFKAMSHNQPRLGQLKVSG